MGDNIHCMLVKFEDDVKWRGYADIPRDRFGTENALDKL